jgi:single-strand DNA-binding protein
MFNKAILVGRLTSDPQSKQSQSGSVFCKFGLATDSGWGEKKETDFHNIVVFGKTAEFVQQYLKKGQLVLVEGRIQMRQYEQEGVKKTYTSIITSTVQSLEKKPIQTAPQYTAQAQVPNQMQQVEQTFGEYLNQGF